MIPEITAKSGDDYADVFVDGELVASVDVGNGSIAVSVTDPSGEEPIETFEFELE